MSRKRVSIISFSLLCALIVSVSLSPYTAKAAKAASYVIPVTQSTWCEGDIVKGSNDTMPIDSTVQYASKDTGMLSFTSNSKGTARFLGMDEVDLQANLQTAYLEIPIKGNGVSSTMDLSFVTVDGAAGSWAQISGITSEWQIKKVMLKDLVTYMGTPDFDDFFYFDLYSENAQGAVFWIGDMTFFSYEPSSSNSSDNDNKEEPAALPANDNNSAPASAEPAVEEEPAETHTMIIPMTATWADGDIVKGTKDTVPIDSTVKYSSDGNEFNTSKITFTENEADGKYYLAMYFLDSAVVNLKAGEKAGYIDIPIKGDGRVKEVEITLCSGVYEQGTEQLAAIILTDITPEWQIKRVMLSDFISSNSNLKLDDLRSFQVRGSKGMVKDASIWLGNVTFVNDTPSDIPHTGEAFNRIGIIALYMIIFGAAVIVINRRRHYEDNL